jgi:hypothetical protein
MPEPIKQPITRKARARAAIARDQSYRSGLRKWATAQGWTYRDAEEEWTSLLPKGEDEWGVRLQLEGSRQTRPVTVAHYWYQTISFITSGDGKGFTSTRTSTDMHVLTVVVVRLAASYPAVKLERRGAVSRFLRLPSENPTGVKEFDRRYQINTTEPGGSALVTPQVISAYLAADLPPWQLSGDQLVFNWYGAIEVGDIDQKVDQAFTVAELLDSRRDADRVPEVPEPG